MSKGYIVAFVEVADFPSFQKGYIEPAGVIMAKYGGKVIAASNEVVNKEQSFPPGFGIILEFPSMEQLEAFYADPDYEPLIKLRRDQGASTLAFLPQGMGH